MMQSSRFQALRILLLQLAIWALLSASLPLKAGVKLPKWDVFVDGFIEGYLQIHPSFAANAGRHEFDGKLPDWSPEGLDRQKQWLKSERQLALQYDGKTLPEPERFEREYLLQQVNSELFWLESVQSPFKNPMFYAGALDPNFYLTRDYAPLDRRMLAFINYAENIPNAATQIKANLQLPLPRTFINIGKTVFGGYAKFYEQDAKMAFAEIDDEQLQKQFDSAAIKAAKAMNALVDWLEQQRAAATDDFAMGSERFQAMLKATEAIDVPLAELEKLGRDDLERNLTALTMVCNEFAPDLAVQACVGKVESQKPIESVIEEARRQLTALKAFVSDKDLVTIPAGEDAMVAKTPPFQRWNSAYIDIPGPFEQKLPSIYYVSPPDPNWTAAEQAAYVPGKANLLFISAHEVWPGHFLQHLHARNSHSKFGQLFGSYAFSEGWAHYSEELMWEAGLNNGDAETHIGQLLNALLRDVRFLSAIGLHTQGMTVEASEKMFRELAFRDPGNAKQQAARGTFDPAYINYTLGKLMIRKLREDWTATRGGKTAWKAFHDTFLSYGAPPIPLVRKAMLESDGNALFD